MRPTLLAVALLAGCTAAAPGEHAKVRIGPGDLADAATTAVALNNGFLEANPVYAWAGDATPLVALGAKYAMKHALVAGGVPAATSNRVIEAFGMGASCYNLVIMAGGVTPPAAILGASCALFYNQLMLQPDKET